MREEIVGRASAASTATNCVVSHLWETPRRQRRRAAQGDVYLHEHPEVEWLWYDTGRRNVLRRRRADRSEVGLSGWHLATPICCTSAAASSCCSCLVPVALWTQFELWPHSKRRRPTAFPPARAATAPPDPIHCHRRPRALARRGGEVAEGRLRRAQAARRPRDQPVRQGYPPAQDPQAQREDAEGLSANRAGRVPPTRRRPRRWRRTGAASTDTPDRGAVVDRACARASVSTGAGTARAIGQPLASFDDDDDLTIVVRADEDVTALHGVSCVA